MAEIKWGYCLLIMAAAVFIGIIAAEKTLEIHYAMKENKPAQTV